MDERLRDVCFMGVPKYSYPPIVLAAFVRDLLLSRGRNFRRDAQACIARLTPPLRVLGAEYIPQTGPCVITVNHYHRRGFGAQWFVLAIASLVPVPIHWVMTGEFTYPGKWYEPFGRLGSQLLLRRIAHVYGFTTMPPMPPRERDVRLRAAAVRSVLEVVKRAEAPVLGLAPEGRDLPGGVLSRPFPGAGRFGLLLSRAGLTVCPVGTYEMDGCLYVHFGQAYELRVAPNLSPDEKDRQASQIIMENIARLLPPPQRGEFA